MFRIFKRKKSIDYKERLSHFNPYDKETQYKKITSPFDNILEMNKYLEDIQSTGLDFIFPIKRTGELEEIFVDEFFADDFNPIDYKKEIDNVIEFKAFLNTMELNFTDPRSVPNKMLVRLRPIKLLVDKFLDDLIQL